MEEIRGVIKETQVKERLEGKVKQERLYIQPMNNICSLSRHIMTTQCSLQSRATWTRTASEEDSVSQIHMLFYSKRTCHLCPTTLPAPVRPSHHCHYSNNWRGEPDTNRAQLKWLQYQCYGADFKRILFTGSGRPFAHYWMMSSEKTESHQECVGKRFAAPDIIHHRDVYFYTHTGVLFDTHFSPV